jgi:hypothetical protein
MAEDETRELREKQQQRAAREGSLAEQSDEPTEEATHRRRSEKAQYLKEKLDERARSEQEK